MNHNLPKDIVTLLTPATAWKYKAIPCSLTDNTLSVLLDETDIHDDTTIELQLITGYKIKVCSEKPDTIAKLLTQYYHNANTATSSTLHRTDSDDLLANIIQEAKRLKSSDIHIESYSEKRRIRFRIDGKLIERYQVSKEEYPSFINKIKIKAQLDIAEKRLPQDGRIQVELFNEKIDIRVSISPSLYGEKVVLRLLSNDAANISIDSLGLDNRQLEDIKRTLKKTNGILLISGPTGSGKTTTLYATLKELNTEHINILTIEDPIEYTLDGINQVQLKENIGLSFASALRTFLRQDPDIIMLGEIRDPETAQMAIRAALTGHLVLSTIHTNSAWATVSRLIDMGIPTFLLSNTLNITIAQRLVRKLCPVCKEPATLENIAPDIEVIEYFPKNILIQQPVGCEKCFYTGYHGRQAIYEVIPVDKAISEQIKLNITDITEYTKQKNISTLKDRAIQLVLSGETSLDEVYPILLNF